MRILLLNTTLLMCFFAGVGSAQDYPWCSKMDEVLAEIDGGDLVLHHENATYNCCPDSFTFTVTVSNDSLYITEQEVLTTPCDCMCCYNLTTVVAGLSPGEWQVVYRWLDDAPWGWRDWDLTVNISAPGPPGLNPIVRSLASGCLDPSGAPEDPNLPVNSAGLLQNIPNPFNPHTTIAFELPTQTAVSLRVYDLSGHLVKVLLNNKVFAEGRHETAWDGRGDTGGQLASGTYFYRLQAGEYSETKSMILVK